MIEIKDLNDNVLFAKLSRIFNQQTTSSDPWKNGLGFDTTLCCYRPKYFFKRFILS